MKKLLRCKKCGYNFLVFVRDDAKAETVVGVEAKEQKCPNCNATI